jgi:hypothetical protein
MFHYVKFVSETVNRMKKGRTYKTSFHAILEGKEIQEHLGDDG